MKESIGGTLLLNLMLFFMITYILFMAGIMKYASAYKGKNAIVELIENTTESVQCSEYKDILLSNGYDGLFSVEEHHNSKVGKSYYTVTLNSNITLIPALLNIQIPIVGETKMIDSNIDITSTNGLVVADYHKAC